LTVLHKFALLYLIIVSLVSIIMTVYDKISAKRGWRRVPENTLVLFSALGGSAAMYLTMQIIRHKTKHIKFMLGIPIIIILQTCFIAALTAVVK
jgi:uncharacterized membrane protein YsdA (DUF1294 family)